MHAAPARKHRPPIRCLGLAAGTAVVIASCGSGPSTPTATRASVDGIPLALPASVTPSVDDVHYTSKTVDVDRATVESSLIGISPDGTYTFSGDSGPLGQLAPGKVMLLDGTDVADVTGVSHSGGHLVVQTQPASLTDLVQNGHIKFSAPMNASRVIAMSDPGTATPPSPSPSASAASATHTVAPGPPHAVLMDTPCTLDRYGGLLPTFSFTGKFLTSWQYRLGFSGCSGQISYTLTLCFGVTYVSSTGRCLTPSGGGGGSAGVGTALSMEVTGYIDWSAMNADVAVSNGSFSHGSYTLDGLTATYNLNAAAFSGNSVEPTTLPVFRVPFGIEFPIEIGVIPFYVKLQAALLVHLALSSKNSILQATSSASATLVGGGAQNGGSSSAAPGTSAGGNGTVSPGESISPAAAAITIAVQLPRIGFGPGVRLANLLWYVDAVWSFGYLVGSAFAGQLCESWDLTVDIGFQIEGSLGSVFKVTTGRVDLGKTQLASGHLFGCPSIKS